MSKVLPFFSSENDLARALIKGDAKAQTLLYEKYGGKMLAICLRYLSDTMEAEDVMIEGFMKIFTKVEQFNFQGSFEGWMKRIMVNEALMALRAKKSFVVQWQEELPKSIADTDQHNTQLETEDLMRLVQELPVGYRAVFNLYAIEGYSHNEIAQLLGISEGTSKSQLSRARSLLQDRLNSMETFTKQQFN